VPRQVFQIRPVEHGISTENPPLFIEPSFTPWISNCRCDRGAVEKRGGYSLALGIGRPVYGTYIFQLIDGSRYTLYLTDTDLCQRETGGISYKTNSYTAGSIASITGAAVVGGSTAWLANVTAGDKFIVNADDSTTAEPDANWATVQSVGSDTGITLTGSYTGATTTGAYRIRKVYSLPSNERWQTAVVNNTFCFTNGNVNVQRYTGAGNAADLDSTNATRARFCMEFANRLFLADMYLSGVRQPLTIKWSKEGDPTEWTDSTSGEADILETDDFITGMARVGANLLVFKRESLHFYSRTGDATSPVEKTVERRGIGNIAPYSIADFLGTCAFLGRDDFYMINGDQAESIGEAVRHKFFDMVSPTEAQNTWAYTNPDEHEIMWFVRTAEYGNIVLTFNYVHNEWYSYRFNDEIISIGRGAI
jgi:hypothetical protein